MTNITKPSKSATSYEKITGHLPQIPGEIWKPLVGYKSRFLVSNMGRLFTRNTGSLAGTENKGGYVRYRMDIKGKRKRFLVHRLVAITFLPNPENKPAINHKNGIKDDNRVENIEWCTHKENSVHAVDTGLFMTKKRIKYIESTKGILPWQLKEQTMKPQSGKHNTMSKPVFVFDSNKVFIRSYESQGLCATDIKGNQPKVNRALKTGVKHRGFYFGYTIDKFNI